MSSPGPCRHLFTPLRVGPLTLANRVVSAACHTAARCARPHGAHDRTVHTGSMVKPDGTRVRR